MDTRRFLPHAPLAALVVFGLSASVFGPTVARAGGPVATDARAGSPITEFSLPPPGRAPAEIVAGPDGNLWFTEGVPDGGIGRITPSGVVTEFPLPASNGAAGLGPVTAGGDGALWFRSTNFTAIDRITPDGQVTEPTKPGRFGSPFEMTLGPDGNIWLTGCDAIARLTNGEIQTFELPVPADGNIEFCTADGWAVGITTGADGNLWFAMNGFVSSGPTNGQIGRITPDGQITFFPTGENTPNEIASGPDGNLWFTDSQHAVIGRSTPSGEMTTYPIPSGSVAHYITAGPDGNLWFTEDAAIGRITTSGRVDEIPLSAGSQPSGITVGADQAIWFTEARGNKIGRLDPDAFDACLPGGRTLCLGIFRVTATWAGSGQSGTGIPASITPNTGAFWFFDPSNVEVFVKVLDACRTTGAFDVYVNGLTHLGVTVTVTNVQTGASRSYANPEGAPFSLIFDGSTFACP